MATARRADPPETVPGRSPWPALAALACGLFISVVSTTVVSVALPEIGRDLGAGPTELQWVVDAYALVYAGLLVTGGAMGDRCGRKGVFLTGVAIFGIGALVTGLAPTVPVLLAGRAVQGLGPALLVPGSLTVIRSLFHDPKQRATAIGLWSTASGLALAVGPVLGGVIVDGPGWRWVFLLNVPLSAAVLLVAARTVPRLARTGSDSRFDGTGAVLITVGIAALTFALIEGQELGWSAPAVLAALVASAAALVAFVIWERRRVDPLVDLTLFARPAFVAANIGGLIVFFAFVGGIVYFSVYFQQVQQHSPLVAGIDVSAIGVAFALTASVSGRLVGRLGARPPILAGLVLAGVSTLGLLRLGPETPIGAVWWNFALVGAGIGMCLTPMTSIAVGAVDPARAGMASAIHNALRQVGQVLGVAVLGALVYAPLDGHDGSGLAPAQHSAFVAGLHHAIWTSGLALLAAAALSAVLLYRSRTGGTAEQRPARQRRRMALTRPRG